LKLNLFFLWKPTTSDADRESLTVTSHRSLTLSVRYCRSAIGSALIVAGLYMVLWGKGREMDKKPGLDSDKGDEEAGAGLAFNGKAAVASNRVEAVSLPVFSATNPKQDATRNGSN